MITLSTSGSSVIFTFSGNSGYLQDGTIEVPVNSLSLITDESGMATFRKSASNDIFISARYEEFGMTKAELEAWYKENMVGETGGGGGVDSGTVQTMINESISGLAESSAVTQEISAAVSGKADSSAVTQEISAAVSGKVDSVSGVIDVTIVGTTANTINYSLRRAGTWSGDKELLTVGSGLTLGGMTHKTLSVDSSTVALKSDVNGKVDTDTYSAYTAATDARITEDEEVTAAGINTLNDALSGKVDTSTYSAYTAATDAALSGKQDTLSAGTNITISGNVISATGGNPTVELTQAQYEALVESGTVEPNTYYIITDATPIDINNYVATSAITSAVTSASTDSEIPTAKAVYDATQGGGGGKAIEAGRGISITTGATADTVSFNLPISAGTGSKSIIVSDGNSKATGNYTFVGGEKSSATTVWAFAFGANCKATAAAAVSFGYQTHALGGSSFTVGSFTRARNDNEHSSGVYNVSNTGSTTADKTLFSVGNGTADNARHNAFEIRQNGDIYITSGGTDIKLQDNLGGGVSESTFSAYTAATDSRMAEDEEVTAAGINSLNDKFDGLKLKKLTQADYDALVSGGTVDNSTLYIITNVVS